MHFTPKIHVILELLSLNLICSVNMKGIIALDIDGTLTGPDHLIAPEVIEYLESLHEQQWRFIFISGRPYNWGAVSLQQLTFPYFLAVYNGAYIISMPDGQIAERHLLNRSVLLQMEKIAEKFATGLVVYGGLEHGENIYFTASRFDEKTLNFFEQRSKISQEIWIPVASVGEIPLENFTSAKYFVGQNLGEKIAEILESELGLYAPLISDPVDSSFLILQATHQEANKGDALENFSSICGWSGMRIAAGNDINDYPMFQKAQITVAMQDSPLTLRELATVIAPPVEDLGLITGLKMAIAKFETRR